MFVKEYLPGCGAEFSKPHAAIVSVTAEPTVGAALAAAQQSRSRRASKLAFSKSVWIADHSREA